MDLLPVRLHTFALRSRARAVHAPLCGHAGAGDPEREPCAVAVAGAQGGGTGAGALGRLEHRNDWGRLLRMANALQLA